MMSGDWIKGVECPFADDYGCGETLIYTEYGDASSDQSELGAECDWCELELDPEELKEVMKSIGV